MVKKIKWSQNAIEDLYKVSVYLSRNWNKVVTEKFMLRTKGKMQQIITHPESGRMSLRDSAVRSVLITQHNRLYYSSLSEEVIEIMNIFDTRQHPAKNLYE